MLWEGLPVLILNFTLYAVTKNKAKDSTLITGILLQYSTLIHMNFQPCALF